jgi:SOS-response transcriptional repressor LexA
VPYNPGPSDPFSGLQNANQYLFTVACDSLNRIGVNRGDVVLVDGSSDACKKIKPLAIVRAQYPPDANHFGKAVSLLRQFVPPSLLITNSSAKNEMPIDTETEDAQIMGVVVSVHRALQG